MGDFNSHNILWGSRRTNKRGQTLEKINNNNNLCLHNRKAQTHPSSSSGTFSAIDLTLSDPATFIEYNWRVHEDSCGSDHFPIIIENTKPGKSDPQPQKPHDGTSKKQTGKPSKTYALTP